MNRTVWAWGRFVGCAVTLSVLIWRLGASPFLDGLRTVDARALAASAGLTLLTTGCCAWRWKVVAGGLGIDLRLPVAVAAYYRSIFLNLTLPGGIAGDIHRGVSHGRETDDMGRAVRVVAWERFAGQVAQTLVTVVILLALPSPVHALMPLLTTALVAALGGVVVLAWMRPAATSSPWARAWTATAHDLRHGLLARSRWPGIALTSVLVVAGHALTFLIAARTAGVAVAPSRMLPIALLVLAAGVLPSVGGWGPREGVTAWAFGAAGLGAGRGVATAVVYGVMVLVASLPGAAVLMVGWLRHTPPPGRPAPLLREEPAHA